MKQALSLVAVFLCAAFFAAPAEAAVFSVSRSAADIRPGDEVTFLVRMATEGEEINSFGGELLLPDFLEATAVRDGNSLTSAWVERPAVREGAVRFAGIVPGGYAGESGLLFAVDVIVRQKGSGNIAFSFVEAYLDDGAGTKAKAAGAAHTVTTSSGAAGSGGGAAPDTTPPESFVPEIGNDPGLFGGRFFIAFAAADKQSGVSSYEVAEKRGFRVFDYENLSWAKAESPNALSDQELGSYVYVKAIDEAGNERVAVVSPRNTPFLYSTYAIGSILIVVLFALFAARAGRMYPWVKRELRKIFS